MDDVQSKQYKKMTETPIWKLVLTLGIPTTISMLITNIYNMADTYFVSQISVSASGATGIVFSLMAILQAFGFMYGHGAGSNISRLLGAKNVEKAKIFSSTAFFLSMLTGTVIMILGLLFLEPFMYLLGSTDTILNEAKTYAFYILIAGPALTAGCVLNNVLRYEGKATLAMVGLTTGGILNMFLDPILIFYMNMGIAGAGLATALSQYISTTILLTPFLRKQTSTRISLKYFTKEFADIQNIFMTGSPTLARQGLNSISTTLLNNQASLYGDAAIAAMSVVGRCSNLMFSAALGIAQGFQPVSAFNYGSNHYKRVKESAQFTMTFGTTVLSILCILCYFNAPTVIGIFRKEAEVVMIGSGALRYLCFALFTLPLSATGNMLFQSIGKSKVALFLSCLQNGLVLIPLLMILPNLIGITGIQIAQPCSYWVAVIVSLPIVFNFFKELDRLEENK